MIKAFQRTNDPRLTFRDFIEESDLREGIAKIEEEFDPFKIVNSNPELLNYQIDIHGGLRKKDAVLRYRKNERRIIEEIKEGKISTNSHYPGQQILKVICGYGHHAANGVA